MKFYKKFQDHVGVNYNIKLKPKIFPAEDDGELFGENGDMLTEPSEGGEENPNQNDGGERRVH